MKLPHLPQVRSRRQNGSSLKSPKLLLKRGQLSFEPY